MIICVTDEDIRHGVKGDCERCMVARAMGRAGLYRARVEADKLCWLMPDGRPCSVPIPRAVVCRVADWDTNREVDAFEFEVDVAAAEAVAANLVPIEIVVMDEVRP